MRLINAVMYSAQGGAQPMPLHAVAAAPRRAFGLAPTHALGQGLERQGEAMTQALKQQGEVLAELLRRTA